MTDTVQSLTHAGPLGQHDLWVVVPMAVLTVIVLVVMARPERPAPDEDEGSEGNR